MRNLRETAFWILDRIKGSPIGNQIKKQQQINSNEQDLSRLLRYARKHVPYYRESPEISLSSFPVIDKSVIKNAYESFRSDEFSDDSKLITLYTSGSSGTPFKAYQNKDKDNSHKAALILLNRSVGWNIGDRWAHLRNWGFGKPATWKDKFIKNMVPLSVLDLNKEKLEHIVSTLVKDKKLHILFGYSSAFERLADYIVQNGYQNLNFGIRLIVADSDDLKSETWDLLEKIFKCPVLNRYGSIENGIFALTKPYDRTFYVDTTQFFIEILKMDCDESVNEGEIGRVVITDLHNKALPFIRYYNGDLAVAKKIVNGQCTEIASLHGREISALRKTDGTLLSETNIMGHFKEFVDISRYQIVQKTADEYCMIVENAPESVDRLCVDELKTIFGADAKVRIVHTDLIPCEKNGKFKVTYSELPKGNA